MRKVGTIIAVIAATGAFAAASASAGVPGAARVAVRPADRFDAVVAAPALPSVRVAVADRLAADLPAVSLAFDATLGAVLAVELPAPVVVAPAVVKPAAAKAAPVAARTAVTPAASVAPVAPAPVRALCAGADGVFRPVTNAAACPGDAALQMVRG